MQPLWMRNKVFGEEIVILDCGYLDELEARERAEQLRNLGIGKRNFRLELNNRLFVHVPPIKVDRIMAALPIKEGARYWGSTHHFQD